MSGLAVFRKGLLDSCRLATLGRKGDVCAALVQTPALPHARIHHFDPEHLRCNTQLTCLWNEIVSSPLAAESNELEIEVDFAEQAEYISREDFLALSAEHPDEEAILRKLSTGGAKLLVGPRGCGKSTLMLKAYYGLLGSAEPTSLPIYINFKLSLKLEPLYVSTPNAAFWFRQWLVLMVYKGLYQTIEDSNGLLRPLSLISRSVVDAALLRLESGRLLELDPEEAFSIEALCGTISKVVNGNGYVRCVLLLDDAAHAFSPKQQEDFFEFFREIKSREISPKAAIYPGITNHSPTFHVGHDAEQIDVWIRPDRPEYLSFMRSLAVKRFRGTLPPALGIDNQVIDFLAYAAFGVPRAFLAMIRSAFEDISDKNSPSALDRRKLFAYARQARESSHNVYDSLSVKLPAYREFVSAGRQLYQNLILRLKEFNKDRAQNDQAVEIALKKPIPSEIEKVLGFFQYAGLLMPAGENSRGVKGVFELYFVHFGDLITENAIVGTRAKAVTAFLTALTSQTHQTWPRVSPDSLVKPDVLQSVFRLSLPQCQTCGAERVNEHARFCPNCGSQLKTASLFHELVAQSIDVLPISQRLSNRVKSGSSIRTIKDILLDSDRRVLRGAPYIGPVRAAKIAHYAEEYLA